MPKSRRTNSRKPAQPARKAGRKPSKPAKPQGPASKAASSRPSKKGSIIALLQRPNGAAISDLMDATGWQVHSVRAALTGLRKEGKEVLRDKDAAEVTRYRLAAEA